MAAKLPTLDEMSELAAKAEARKALKDFKMPRDKLDVEVEAMAEVILRKEAKQEAIKAKKKSSAPTSGDVGITIVIILVMGGVVGTAIYGANSAARAVKTTQSLCIKHKLTGSECLRARETVGRDEDRASMLESCLVTDQKFDECIDYVRPIGIDDPYPRSHNLPQPQK